MQLFYSLIAIVLLLDLFIRRFLSSALPYKICYNYYEYKNSLKFVVTYSIRYIMQIWLISVHREFILMKQNPNWTQPNS